MTTGRTVQLYGSGRDPQPWEIPDDTLRIVFEETNSMAGSGIAVFNYVTEQVQYLKLLGNHPAPAPNGQMIAYLGGQSGDKPAYARASENWTEHQLSNITATHIQALDSATVCFDSYPGSILYV